MIDFTKAVRTLDGDPVRIICTDMSLILSLGNSWIQRNVKREFPILGLVTKSDGKEHCVLYDKDGRCGGSKYSQANLMNCPPTDYAYVNIYDLFEHSSLNNKLVTKCQALYPHLTKESAIKGCSAIKGIVANSHILKITFENKKPIAVELLND